MALLNGDSHSTHIKSVSAGYKELPDHAVKEERKDAFVTAVAQMLPHKKGKTMKTITAVVLSAGVLLSGCYTPGFMTADQVQHRIVKLTAVGYGSGNSHETYSPGQKRLMAMRASKLDAYRALAEQVHGVRVTGNSTVGALMVQSDSFRVYIDAYVRGARVLTVTPMADGNYETTIELDFDEQMVRNYASQWQLRGAPATMYSPGYGTRGAVNSGSMYGSSFYYAD